MKRLHKDNLYCWSEFDEDRNIDFHSYVWARETASIIFDPLPMTKHDEKHLLSLGPVSHIIISNSDHIRDSARLAKLTGAKICGPLAEREDFGIVCDIWLEESGTDIDGLTVFSLEGSKTPGELAFAIEGDTLITGDLIRAHEGGRLCLLPAPKLKDQELARNSVTRIASLDYISAILPGDGWPIFRDGQAVLRELSQSIK